ncbi:hypothetical protein EVAR_35201_1 [Eumeta japonica]|uniref:Uncharacterized protein n=1 Tax=Eumeta variegata TaxID=151549 RepID=A0A4C1VBU3_EUMVA|nr:hypothetical protein EVAR_35201_1 [Eumeta japonica]
MRARKRRPRAAYRSRARRLISTPIRKDTAVTYVANLAAVYKRTSSAVRYHTLTEYGHKVAAYAIDFLPRDSAITAGPQKQHHGQVHRDKEKEKTECTLSGYYKSSRCSMDTSGWRQRILVISGRGLYLPWRECLATPTSTN